MTRLAKTAAVAALAGLVVLAGATGGLRVQTAAPAQPFWQLQGAGPAIAPESAAIVGLRTAERDVRTSGMLAEAE